MIRQDEKEEEEEQEEEDHGIKNSLDGLDLDEDDDDDAFPTLEDETLPVGCAVSIHVCSLCVAGVVQSRRPGVFFSAGKTWYGRHRNVSRGKAWHGKVSDT